jgi:anti-sigma regulatory factor (Ser/Thr protein kinase)
MKKRIEFASHPANLWLVRHCVRQFLQNRTFSSREIDLMVLGVDEACTNIIRHAYHQAEDQLISLSLETTKNNGVRFRLRDYGDCFDATRSQGRALDQLRPGGLGVHLIRHAFDKIDYQQRRRGTLLVLTKLKPDTGGFVPELAPNWVVDDR